MWTERQLCGHKNDLNQSLSNKKTIKYSGQQKCYVKTKQQLHDATVFKQLKSENNGAGTQVETHSYSMKVFTFVIPMHPAWYLALVNPSK